MIGKGRIIESICKMYRIIYFSILFPKTYYCRQRTCVLCFVERKWGQDLPLDRASLGYCRYGNRPIECLVTLQKRSVLQFESKV